MIPEKMEYLFLLLLYFLGVFTFLPGPTTRLLRTRSFWLSCGLFCVSWALIEILALRSGWWIFSPRKLCGVTLATVPLEEYVAFALIHLSTAATWTALKRRHDVP